MAIVEKGRMADGITILSGGMDSGRAPSVIDKNQCAYAGNISFRGGYAKTRSGFKRIQLATSAAATAFIEARFQGAAYFDYSDGQLVAVAGGNTYKLTPQSSGLAWDVADITNSITLSATVDRVHFVQVEGYLIIQDGLVRPLIWDGSAARRSDDTEDEVPIGSGPMAYGQGRLWVAQGRNFVAGDIVYGSSHPSDKNLSVLRFTENSYLAGGGKFTVATNHGDITAMRFVAAPNTALGQGELMIFTSEAVYSMVVPADRYDWYAVSDPQQRVLLINNGAMSHYSTELVNGDIYFRSRDGLRSLVQAVRDFTTPGNTPLSREMNRIFKYDAAKYLQHSSGVLFDNRYLVTSQDDFDDTRGIAFKGLAALDFDLISGVSGKAPPAFDGFWTLDITRSEVDYEMQFYQLVKGRLDGVERCFAFSRPRYLDDGTVTYGDTELWELNIDGAVIEDTDVDGSGVETANKITSELETPSFDFEQLGSAKTLESADLWVDQVTGGTVTFHTDFHPDQYPCWVGWQDWSVVAESANPVEESTTLTGTAIVAEDSDQLAGTGTAFETEISAGDVITVGGGARLSVDTVDSDTLLTLASEAAAAASGAIVRVSSTCNDLSADYQQQYRPRMRIGKPSEAEEPATGKPFNYGWEFSARIKWTGHARVKLFRLNARETQEEPYADVNMDAASKAIACDCVGGVSNITNQ